MSCPAAPLSPLHPAAPAAAPAAWPLPESPTLSEVFPVTAVDGAGPGFVLAAIRAQREAGPRPPDRRPVLWIQDRLSLKETGRPYLAGLATPPDLPPEMLHLVVGRAADVLWAMEQGLGCPGLAAVVGEIWGPAAAVDFTATKRLALRAEAHGVAAWLIRRAAAADLSAARMRWRLASVPSERDADDPRAPGGARWQAELFRARSLRPGLWTVRHDPGGTLAFVPAPTDTGRDTAGTGLVPHFASNSGPNIGPHTGPDIASGIGPVPGRGNGPHPLPPGIAVLPRPGPPPARPAATAADPAARHARA